MDNQGQITNTFKTPYTDLESFAWSKKEEFVLVASEKDGKIYFYDIRLNLT